MTKAVNENKVGYVKRLANQLNRTVEILDYDHNTYIFDQLKVIRSDIEHIKAEIAEIKNITVLDHAENEIVLAEDTNHD